MKDLIPRREQHNHLFDQFVYELFCEPEKQPIKSKGGLCKRAKFLSKPQNLKQKGELKNEIPKLNRSTGV